MLFFIALGPMGSAAYGWYKFSRYCGLRTGTEVWRQQGYKAVRFIDCMQDGCSDGYRSVCERVQKQGQQGGR
jgi:hypothetical protein